MDKPDPEEMGRAARRRAAAARERADAAKERAREALEHARGHGDLSHRIMHERAADQHDAAVRLHAAAADLQDTHARHADAEAAGESRAEKTPGKSGTPTR
jgi:hypothetical protein